MFSKKALVSALVLAAVSGSAMADAGDIARVDNLKWVSDLTTQTLTGNLVITDQNDQIIQAGTEYALGNVSDDLTFAPNYGSEAVLEAHNFTDANTDGIADQAEVGDPVAASWVVNSVKYDVIAGGAVVSTGVTPNVNINGVDASIDGTTPGATGVDTIKILIDQATAPAAVEGVTKAIVTMSISATQDA